MPDHTKPVGGSSVRNDSPWNSLRLAKMTIEQGGDVGPGLARRLRIVPYGLARKGARGRHWRQIRHVKGVASVGIHVNHDWSRRTDAPDESVARHGRGDVVQRGEEEQHGYVCLPRREPRAHRIECCPCIERWCLIWRGCGETGKYPGSAERPPYRTDAR